MKFKTNKILYLEKYAFYLLLLFYAFRNVKELLSGWSPSYQNKHLEPGVEFVVNSNKIKCKLDRDLVWALLSL